MNVNVLSIMNRKTKEFYTFTYFDEKKYVLEIGMKILENPTAAITAAEEFEKIKNEMTKKAYFDYMEKVKKNTCLGIVEKLYVDGDKCVNIMIYDNIDEIFRKYSIAYNTKLNSAMKKEILNHYYKTVESILTSEILDQYRKENKNGHFKGHKQRRKQIRKF